ncbi:hypothetical protein BV20DRAFT_959244, partial [Pilatotrama ljubarskyi]
TALGHYKPLLPVVVTCANEEDAKALNRLNKTVFNIVSTKDNHSLIYKCTNSPVTDLRIVGSPVYACRVAVETGVWIGFEWSQISYVIDGFKPKAGAAWCKPTTISQALIFMLSKPGYNLPLLPPGAPIPPPLKHHPTTRRTSARSHPPPSPWKSAGTPAKSRTPKMTVKFEHAASTPPPSPSSSRARMRFKEASSSSSTTVPAPSNSTPTRGSSFRGPPPPDPTEDLAMGMSFAHVSASCLRSSSTLAVGGGLDLNMGCEYLSRIILPPPSMFEASQPALSISFGHRADERLLSLGANAEQALLVLPTRVHSHNVAMFAYHTAISLGWDLQQCKKLYEEIRFPGEY